MVDAIKQIDPIISKRSLPPTIKVLLNLKNGARFREIFEKNIGEQQYVDGCYQMERRSFPKRGRENY